MARTGKNFILLYVRASGIGKLCDAQLTYVKTGSFDVFNFYLKQ